MTMLTALASYYDRLADKREVPPFGYSVEKIGWCLVIDPTGAVRSVVSLMQGEGRKARPRLLAVPQPTIRTSGIASNFLWDKTAYVLGVTAGAGKRTAQEHDAFKALHRELLAGTDDPGLQALLAFLDRWTPDQFVPPAFPEEMKDGNVVFRIGDERAYLHDTPAARAIWARRSAGADGPEAVCLVRGERGPIARLHPPIKGVWGAQSSGARIVSFNCDAFTSYGQEQGANAPVGEAAAFAYTTVLNRFLATDSGNRVQIGDASTVFWADGADAEKTALAEDAFAAMLGIDDKVQANRVKPILEAVAQGRPLTEFDPELAEGVRFYVLGLSPNAARLSVRFWFEDRFGWFADNVARHAADLRIEPSPQEQLPTVDDLLLSTAPAASRNKSRSERRKLIPPQVAGDVLRAILSGGRYPATLLSTLLMRLRADGDMNALRIAMLKAIVRRTHRIKDPSAQEDKLVALDPDNRDPGYLLGRLFSVYERAQLAALPGINATIKDKFYGAASTTPRSVFPLLARNANHHVQKIRKDATKSSWAARIEKDIAEIMGHMHPAGNPFPLSMNPEQQALFALGYWHQRSHRSTKDEQPAIPNTGQEGDL